jgi:hypothetical protein
MPERNILGNQPQIPLALSRDYTYTHGSGVGLLGNPKTQFAQNEQERVRLIGFTEWAKRSPIVFNEYLSSARLEELKRQKFTEEGKEERIAKALAALSQETAIELPTEVWRLIAEDPDLEDQF